MALTPRRGDAEPRRTLDPRAEAVRFFGVGTRSVLLLRSDMPRPAGELAAIAAGYPGPAAVVAAGGELLAAGGIDPKALLRLGRNEEGDGPGTELAAGFAAGPAGDRLLIVMPTDRPDDLDALLETADLQAAGEYDNAVLYQAPGAAFAARDGVLVAAGTLAEVRRALAIRDGEDSRQLDDGEIAAALDDVPTRAPVHLIARRGERFAAVAVRPDPDGAELRIAADVPEGDVDEEAETPHRVMVEPEDLTRILREEAGLPEATVAQLAEVAPLPGASYRDGDRYIATFTVEAP